jgi:MATE family multidrug resistance protein
MQHPYQLSRHPIGILKEFWDISWPLMLGLLSGSLMMFADRLILARYSTESLTATITSGLAVYVVLIIPLVTAGISEVFVGRYNGASQAEKIGKPVWQMIWLSILCTPFFWLATKLLPFFLFYDPAIATQETDYFTWMIYFAPAFCSTIALMGFFIGIGKVKLVTLSAFSGNILNIILGMTLIFGAGPIPSMGIKGAAIGTGLSQLCQTLFLLFFFLKHSNRKTYNTHHWHFDMNEFKEAVRIGAPAGLGKFLELCAHLIFFQLIKSSGINTVTIVGMVQSFYLLSSFLIEGLSKGVSSISANLLGADQMHLVNKVMKSAMLLQSVLASLLFGIFFFFSDVLFNKFFPEQHALLSNPYLFATLTTALYWMALFFLLDGFGWIYAGFLTASGDTKFLLYAGIGLNWLGYILPTYILFNMTPFGNAANGWMIVTIYAFLTFITYWLRFRSGNWSRSFHPEMELAV